MPGKGFTLSILPHGGKPPRQYEFSGARLVALRIGVAFSVLLLGAALAIVISGADVFNATSSLRRHVSGLEDSLDEYRSVSVRLDSIEVVLGQVEQARMRIESLATLEGPSSGDSL